MHVSHHQILQLIEHEVLGDSLPASMLELRTKSARGFNLRQPYTLFNHSVPWSGAVRRWSWRKRVGKEISTGVLFIFRIDAHFRGEYQALINVSVRLRMTREDYGKRKRGVNDDCASGWRG